MRKRMRGMAAAIHLLIALFLATPAVLAAGDVPVSLPQALVLADQRNPEILAQRARVGRHGRPDPGGEAKELAAPVPRRRLVRRPTRRPWSSPRSSTPASSRQQDFVMDRLNDPGALPHPGTALAAEVPLDVFGKTGARTEVLAAAGGAGEGALDEGRQDLHLRVVEAYRRAAVAQRMAEVAERAVASARAREAEVDARVAEGAALGADLLRVRARRRQREAELAERRADARIALAHPGAHARRRRGDAYRPVDPAPPPPPLEGELAAWTARALRAPALLARRGGARGEPGLVAARRAAREPARSRGLGPGPGRPERRVRRPALSGPRGARALERFRPARGRARGRGRGGGPGRRAGGAGGARSRCGWRWRRPGAAPRPPASATPPRPGARRKAARPCGSSGSVAEQGLATLTDELETEAASLPRSWRSCARRPRPPSPTRPCSAPREDCEEAEGAARAGRRPVAGVRWAGWR